MFLGIYTAISSLMANSEKFSAIFSPFEAELAPRASRRMGVEEKIQPRPQGFSLKKCLGMRKWGQGWKKFCLYSGIVFLTFYLCHQQLDHAK